MLLIKHTGSVPFLWTYEKSNAYAAYICLYVFNYHRMLTYYIVIIDLHIHHFWYSVILAFTANIGTKQIDNFTGKWKINIDDCLYQSLTGLCGVGLACDAVAVSVS